MVSSQMICVYCDGKESIKHTFSERVQFVKAFSQVVFNCFHETNRTQLNPTMEEKLFGVTSDLDIWKKCNKEI